MFVMHPLSSLLDIVICLNLFDTPRTKTDLCQEVEADLKRLLPLNGFFRTSVIASIDNLTYSGYLSKKNVTLTLTPYAINQLQSLSSPLQQLSNQLTKIR